MTLALFALAVSPLAMSQVCPDQVSLDLATAVQARSAATAQRSEDVTRRDLELDRVARGLSASIALRPSIGMGDSLDLGEVMDAGDLLGYQIDASVGYRLDGLAILRAEAAARTAVDRLAAQERADVLDALLASSRARVAARALATAVQEHDAAVAALARAEATAVERAADPEHVPLPGTDAAAHFDPSAPPLFLREARLQERRARVAVEDAERAVAAQEEVLSELGLASPAAAPWGCPLAPIGGHPGAVERQPGASDATRIALELAVEVARATLERAWLAPVRDIRLAAHYQEGGGRAGGSVGISQGRPDADLSFRWRPSGKDGWRVSLSANLRVDDTVGEAIAKAAAALERAEQELALHDAAYEARSGAAADAVYRAWTDVELADEALAIARSRKDDPSEARNLPRNEQAVGRALDARERALQGYYRAYAAYLATVGGSWRVAP